MKNFINRYGSLMILVVVLILPLSLLAQEKGSMQPQPQISPGIESVTLAKELAAYGYINKKALPLINAAQILIDENAGALKIKETKRGGTGEPAEISLDVQKLLTDAEAFAGDDKNLKGLIKSLRDLTAASRGRVGGPGYAIDKVAGEEANIHTVDFTGGESAEVAVVGSGNTDLDLYIFDEDGNLVVMDEGSTDECYVIWKPRVTGLFYITVMNRGKTSNEYALVTN